jgi:hypothetical protein
MARRRWRLPSVSDHTISCCVHGKAEIRAAGSDLRSQQFNFLNILKRHELFDLPREEQIQRPLDGHPPKY